MERHELAESWAITLRHLAACRFYLPEVLPSEEAMAAERDLAHFLHHNEFGLALEEAQALGECCDAPAAFWLELQHAAANMDMTEEAGRYAARAAADRSSRDPS